MDGYTDSQRRLLLRALRILARELSSEAECIQRTGLAGKSLTEIERLEDRLGQLRADEDVVRTLRGRLEGQ